MKTLRPYQLDVVSKLKLRLKTTKHPLLVTASVGAGKSLIIAEILLWIEKSNYRALCLTLNGTLIQQNSDAYKSQGGHCGIYAASLNSKITEPLVIFGSPQSVCNGIRDQDTISNTCFNLIVIDECHNVDPHDSATMYQRIINHFGHLAMLKGHSYRIIGLTGTPYRGKGNSIIGENQFFREEVCNIDSSWLISQGYLTKPIFGITETQGYDFSNIRVNSMGKFSGAELSAIVDSNARLTSQIIQELRKIMQTRKGAFIFASTKKHCEECAKSLPDDEWAIITGETPHEERKRIIEFAKLGKLKYLISVNCLNVGIDIPLFDCCAWLRPTESLVLYTQGIGRVLRLHKGKTEAIILDYAGNLQRHGDINNPIINEALQPKEENEKDYIIPCCACNVLNTIHSRRCIGVSDNGRCDNYFEWKDCASCGIRNDTTSRACRGCGCELIDPNAKLSLKAAKPEREIFTVANAKYWVVDRHGYPQFNVMYALQNGLNIYESYSIKTEQTKNIFYGNFVRHCVEKSSSYYLVLDSLPDLQKLLRSGDIRVPHKLECSFDKKYKIHKRIFE